MSDFALYNYFRSSTSYRVRIALNWKGIPYDYRIVHLLRNGGEQHSESYRDLNPAGGVPTLLHNKQAVSESLAILQYLEDIKPKPNIFPSDPYLKAKVLQFCEHINSGMHPLQNLSVMKFLESEFHFDSDKKNRWLQHWIGTGMQTLEKILQKSSGSFCFGGQLTSADICLIPQIFSAQRFNVDLSSFPNVLRINDHCLTLDAFKRAHPLEQPDANMKI